MAYWVFEYGKVLIAYIALMYIWPMVVFRRYLAPKSRTYKFAFCTTVQVILINTVVLLLGLVHILNRWTMILFLWRYLSLITLEKKIYGRRNPKSPSGTCRNERCKIISASGDFFYETCFQTGRKEFVALIEGKTPGISVAWSRCIVWHDLFFLWCFCGPFLWIW